MKDWRKLFLTLALLAIPYGGGFFTCPTVKNWKNKGGIIVGNFFAYAFLFHMENFSHEILEKSIVSVQNLSLLIGGTVFFMVMVSFVLNEFDAWKEGSAMLILSPVLGYLAGVSVLWYYVFYFVLVVIVSWVYARNQFKGLEKKGRGLLGEIIVPGVKNP